MKLSYQILHLGSSMTKIGEISKHGGINRLNDSYKRTDFKKQGFKI